MRNHRSWKYRCEADSLPIAPRLGRRKRGPHRRAKPFAPRLLKPFRVLHDKLVNAGLIHHATALAGAYAKGFCLGRNSSRLKEEAIPWIHKIYSCARWKRARSHTASRLYSPVVFALRTLSLR